VVQPTWVEVVRASTFVACVAFAVVLVEDDCRRDDTSSVILVWVKSDALRRIRWTKADIYMRRQCIPVAENLSRIERRGLTAVVH
jgi:hypothetical protein